jgi:hypothetical protein
MVVCGECPALRTIWHRFDQVRVAPMQRCRASRLSHALPSSVASQDQERPRLRQFASRRTLKPNDALKGTVRMKLPAKITLCGPHGPLA